MILKELTAEFQAGEVKLNITLKSGDDPSILDRLSGRIFGTIAQQEEGVDFEGRIRYTDGQSEVAALLSEDWHAEDAQRLADFLTNLSLLFSGCDRFDADSRSSESDTLDEGSENDSEETLEDADILTVDGSGWIQSVFESEPRLARIIESKQIESDKEYKEAEASLPVEHRIQLAEYRFRFGVEHCHNPDAPGERDLRLLAAFSPPWIESIPMTLPGFKVRARNALTRSGVTTMSQLENLSPDRLLRLPSFGRLTYEQTFQSLVSHLMAHAANELRRSHPERRAAGLSQTSTITSFQALWLAILELVEDQRDRDVLSRRIGVTSCGVPETLDAIGKDYDITRERIRQLQAKAVGKLHANPKFQEVRSNLESELQREMDWRGGAIPLGGNSPTVALRGASPAVLKGFFQQVLKSPYKVLITGSDDEAQVARVVYGVSEHEHDQAIKDVRTFILEHADRPRSAFIPLVHEFIKDNFHESIQADLREFVDDWINWDYSSDPGIISFGDSVQAAVAAVIERSDKPLSLAEIVEESRQQFGLEQVDRSIMSVPSQLAANPGKKSRQDVVVPIFEQSRGVFCSARHLPIDLESVEYLVPELVNLIKEGRECLIPGEAYQWHTLDLWHCLNERLPDNEFSEFSSKDGWRCVDAILRFHEPEGVVNLKRGFWVRRIPGAKQVRRNKSELIEYVLREHGDEYGLSRRELLTVMQKIQSVGVIDPLQSVKDPVVLQNGRYQLKGHG